MDTKLIKKLIRCYFFKNYYTNVLSVGAEVLL